MYPDPDPDDTARVVLADKPPALLMPTAFTTERPTLPPSVEEKVQASIAKVKAAVMIARMFPRDMASIYAQVLDACSKPALARRAFWRMPRGNEEISGPSIRLAEAIARSWGHLDYGLIEHGRYGDHSQVEAFCWDQQTNNRRQMLFTAEHVRWTKKGAQQIENPSEIYEIIASAGQRRVRDCILAHVPRDLVELAREACNATLARFDTDLGQSLQAAVNAFAVDFGVNQTQLENYLDKPLNQMTQAHLDQLREIFNTLSDGGAKVNEYFAAPAVVVPAAEVKAAEPAKVVEEAKPEPAKKGKGPKKAGASASSAAPSESSSTSSESTEESKDSESSSEPAQHAEPAADPKPSPSVGGTDKPPPLKLWGQP